jgi:beta-lactamase class A
MNLNRREFLLAMATVAATTPQRNLLQQWQAIAHTTDGAVGAAALHFGTGSLVSMNGDEHFPLASVCKVPIAMHILARVDEKRLSLDQEIEVLPRDVWSGLSDLRRGGRINGNSVWPKCWN